MLYPSRNQEIPGLGQDCLQTLNHNLHLWTITEVKHLGVVEAATDMVLHLCYSCCTTSSLSHLLKPRRKPWLPTHILPARCHPPGPQPTLCTTMGFTYTPWPCSYPSAPSACGWGKELNSAHVPWVPVDVLPRTAGSTPVKPRIDFNILRKYMGINSSK